jgi:hypothetical protein
MSSCEVRLRISRRRVTIIDISHDFPHDRYRAFMEAHGIQVKQQQVSPCG